MSSKVYIYALRESGSDEVRYVGQTMTPESRLKAHVAGMGLKNENPKRQWVENATANSTEIVMDILEECLIDAAVFREQYWIDYHRAIGCDLTNTSKAIKAKVIPAEQRTVETVSVRLGKREKLMLDAVHAKYPAASRGGCLLQVMHDLLCDKLSVEVQP
jgi:hypothetical protein